MSGKLKVVSQVERERLRQTFDEAAELYDRARPGYPAQLFGDLTELCALEPGSRVLEIGAGTGQLTVPLAEQGYRVVAVELGAEMATVARRKLGRFATVEVVVAPFEQWPLPPEPFDAVVSATAFHWIDPAVRLAKSAAALRPGGPLAIIGTHHVAGDSDEFFAASQACYERWDQTTTPGLRLPAAPDVPHDSEEIDASGLFSSVTFRRYEWYETYTAQQYIDLLLTYSGHRTLPSEAQRGLLDCIAELIECRFGGRITKHYLTELQVAWRR